MSVRVEKNNHVTTIIIDRAEARNAVDRPTAEQLVDAFRAFDADDNAFVAVLCGAGETFCAGADLKAWGGTDTDRRNRVEIDGDGPMGPSRMMLSKPVIAAISGHAVAGGMELAAWCDLRVMEETAVVGVYCRRFGVPLIDGGTIRLPRLIGMSRALDLILTGRPVEADEALAIGLANRLAPHGKAREMAEELARELCRFPQTCMRSDRLSAYEQWDLSLEEALKNEFGRGNKVLESGETIEGAKRFSSGKGRHGSYSEF